MSWARLDDAYYRHPKVQAAGVYGMCLDIAGICYAADHATDGFIPDVALPTLLAFANRGQHRDAALRLVQVGRWLRDDDRGGFWVHDFLDYNPSAAERAKASEAAKQRAAASRRRRSGAQGVQRTHGERSENVHFSRTPTPKNRTTRGSSSPLERATTDPTPPNPPGAPPSPSPESGDDSAPDNPSRCRHHNDPTTCGLCSPAVGTPPPRADIERALRVVPDQEAEQA